MGSEGFLQEVVCSWRDEDGGGGVRCETEFWPAGLGVGVHAQYREGWGVKDSCRKLSAAGGMRMGGRGGVHGTELWPTGLGLGVHAQYREG